MTRTAIALFVTLATVGGGAAAAQAQPAKAKVGGSAKASVEADAAGAEASAQADTAAEAAAPDDEAPDAKEDAKNELPDIPALEGPPSRSSEGPTITKKSWEDIVVVPRKAFLKDGRLELSPFTGVSLNDVLIRHYSLGGDLNYYLTDAFSIGVQGQYFVKERTDRESIVGLQYNRIPTLNKYKYSGALNFGYVPGYGKFTLFNKYIFHWDVLASAGVGVIWTEIIPRVAGDQTFVNTNIAPNVGVGFRFFLNDWLTFSLAFRDYVFNDRFEPLDRMRGDDIATVKDRATSQLVNNVMLYAAVGFYLPTSFTYRTPR